MVEEVECLAGAQSLKEALMKKRTILLSILILLVLSLSACGSSVELILHEGNSAYARGDYESALVEYSQAREISPWLAEPVYNLANTLYRLGSFEDAVGLLTQAIETASDELAEHGFYNLGNNHFQLGKMEQAIEAYKEALRLNPGDLDAKYNLELALLQQEQQQPQQQKDQQQQGDQSQSKEDQADQGQGQQNGEPHQEGQEGGGQTQSGDPQASQNPADSPQEPGDTVQGGAQQTEGLTEEQARQLLAAIGQATGTLQEKLEEIYGLLGQPPAKDW